MGERPSPRASAGSVASLVRTSEASAPRALPAAPGAANLHFPRAGLSSGQREQPSQARTRPAEPAAPSRPLGPRQRGWAWAPTATAPPTRAREKSEPHPRRRLRTYLQGTVGLLDSGRGPEGRRRGGRSPSPGSLGVRDGAGRGRKPGGLRPASAARRGVARTWLSPQHQAVAAAAILPSTPCRRRSPPRVSRMWAFPGVACAGAEDWGLQAAPLGPGASAWLAASCTAARPSPRVRVSIACGLQSPEEWSRYHRILAPHRDVTQARRCECGSHRERAVSGAPRPRTFGGKTCRA